MIKHFSILQLIIGANAQKAIINILYTTVSKQEKHYKQEQLRNNNNNNTACCSMASFRTKSTTLKKSYSQIQQYEIEKEDDDDDEFQLSSSTSSDDDDNDIAAINNINNNNTQSSTIVLGIVSTLAYVCTYFWRYPIFLLPPEILTRPVWKHLDLQDCFSLAFVGGFGSSKLLGMQLLSSSMFFRHRLVILLSMVGMTMLVEGVGVWLLPVKGKVLSVFVSSFVQSWIYGAILTYLEGRQTTETLLALITAGTIAAGGLSRGTASMVLQWIPTSQALVMPLAIGIVMGFLACILLCIADRQPKPSRQDLASRCPRPPVTPTQQAAFFRRYGYGVCPIYVAYALLLGVRSFRDFYAQPIFTAALEGIPPPSWVYLVVDLPGATLSAFVICAFQTYNDHFKALSTMLTVCMAFGGLVLLSTMCFRQQLVGGLFWQLCLGTGIYGSFGILTTAIHERLIAATRTVGTCTFLVLLGDACAYLVTIAILLARDFGRNASTTTAAANISINNTTTATLPEGAPEDVLDGFVLLVYFAVGVGVLLLFCARIYFARKLCRVEISLNDEGVELT
jgi:hypothetical protein